MVSDREADRESGLDAYLREAVGYRVDAPEGYLGLIQGVPEAGLPRRPIVLVVSDGETARFVSLQRVVAVLPFERRIVLGRRKVAPVSLGCVSPPGKAA